MAIHLLSPITLDRLKPEPGKSEAMFNDGGGLWLRVRPGMKTWLFIYTKPTGGRGKETLGNFPDLSLVDARGKAQERRRMLAEDIDPGLQRKAAKDTQRALASKTLGDLLTGYVAHLTRLEKPSAKQVERSLRPIGDTLRKLPATSVTSDDLMAPIRKLSTAGKLRAAGILRSNLNAAFNLAINAKQEAHIAEDMLGFGVTTNPVVSIRPVAGGQGYDSPGEQVIPDDVMRGYWGKLQALKPSESRDVLLVHLLTGNRVEQIIKATTEGDNLVLLDLKGRRSRPRRHVVPMTQTLKGIMDNRGGRAFAITPSAIGKRLKRLLGDYTVRDVRRTMSTTLAGLGISSDVENQLLSHGMSGVVLRSYNMHTYHAGKLAGLLAWENWLKQTTSDNVVFLSNAA